MSQQQLIFFVLIPLASYFLGAIPFAWVLGKSKGVDIRTVGSKNIGATNLGRTLGKKYFWYAFLLDAAKGFVPVLIVALLTRQEGSALPSWTPLLTALACVLGHNFPVYLKFKGGKGVATSFGVVVGFWPAYTLAGLAGAVVFILVLLAYRYISVSSMVSSLAFALFVTLLTSFSNPYVHTYLAWADRRPLIVIAWLFAGMIVVRHRSNIARLMKGTERKIGQREIDRSKMP